MNFKPFISSFQDKRIFPVFIAEGLSLGSILLFSFLLGKFLQNKIQTLLGGRTPQEIQQLFVTSPELAVSLSKNIFSYVLWTFSGVVLFLFGSLLLYSLGKAWIWNFLGKKQFTRKTYWRWNLLHLAVILPLFGYALLAVAAKLILFGMIKLIFKNFPAWSLLHKPAIDQSLLIFDSFLNFSLLLGGFLFLFLIYFSFVHKYKVWASLGEAFSLLRIKFRLLGKTFLYILAGGVLFNLLLFFFKRIFFPYRLSLPLFLMVVLFLLLLSWMQVFLARRLKESAV